VERRSATIPSLCFVRGISVESRLRRARLGGMARSGITDHTRPRMTGDTLAQALRCKRPDIPIILCTGFSYTINAEHAEALGVNAWLAKPWQTRGLAHTIQHVLAQRYTQEV
jgi:CheY-like chemotaxis protein